MAHEDFTGRGALWIKGDKAKPFKALLLKISQEVGGYREAREFIPLSGKSVDLVNKLEVTEGTARRITDAYDKLKERKKKEAYKKLKAMFE